MGTLEEQARRPFSRSELTDCSDDDDFVLGLDSAESDFSSDESQLPEDGGLQQFPPLEPKDPRSKAKYNIFSRLFFL